MRKMSPHDSGSKIVCDIIPHHGWSFLSFFGYIGSYNGNISRPDDCVVVLMSYLVLYVFHF